MIQLRPYQEEAIAAVLAAEQRGVRRQLVAMATGLGKTVVFSELLRQRGGRAVVLAHRDELVTQARAKLRAVWPQASIGIVKGAEDQWGGQVVVASVQTLGRSARLERVLAASRYLPQLGPVRTVIADEAHHYVAGDESNTFGRVLEGLGCGTPEGPLLVGVTATPERGDRKALGDYWDEVVYEKGILEGIREGYLAPIRALEVRLECDFRALHTRQGDVVAGEAGRMLHDAHAPKHTVAAYLAHAPGRKALCFTPTIALAHEMAAAFTAAGIAAEAVDGAMGLDERRAVLQRFHEGATQIVANAQVLTEGYDEPSVSCVILARPTKSRVLLLQMLGRGTRTFPGKEDCVVLDLVGSTDRDDLLSVARLFRSEEQKQKAASAGREPGDELATGGGGTEAPIDADGRLVAREVDLMRGHRFHWVQVDPGQFVLPLGQRDGKDYGSVHLARRGDDEASWEVVRTWRDDTGHLLRASVAQGLTLGYAQGVAEERVRRTKTVVMNDRKAEWRRREPTAKQRALLERWGAWQDGMLMGEASDLITARFAVRV